MLAIAAMLLVAAFAATPARAQEVPPTDPPPEATPIDPPSTDAGTPPTVPDLGPPVSAPAEPPADSGADPAPVDAVAETTASPQDEQRVPARQPSHNGDGSSEAQGTATQAAPATDTGGDTTVATVAPSSDGQPDAWGGQDTFVVDKGDAGHDGAAAAYRGPLSGLLVLRGASRISRVEAKARRSHTIAKVSALGGPPGSGHQLPGQNPFFNLLSGPGGAAAGLALASILAVLGTAFLLPRDRSRTFRMPTVSWRPLAYVPPIELPG